MAVGVRSTCACVQVGRGRVFLVFGGSVWATQKGAIGVGSTKIFEDRLGIGGSIFGGKFFWREILFHQRRFIFGHTSTRVLQVFVGKLKRNIMSNGGRVSAILGITFLISVFIDIISKQKAVFVKNGRSRSDARRCFFDIPLRSFDDVRRKIRNRRSFFLVFGIFRKRRRDGARRDGARRVGGRWRWVGLCCVVGGAGRCF